MKLAAIDLVKTFDSLVAVNHLNLTVENELFVFLGPNGAGKTTTIKMMTGLLIPTSGTVLLSGHDIQKNPLAAKKLIGFVPEEPFLYPKLSAREYVQFIARVYQVDPVVSERRRKNLFELFDIGDRSDDLIQNFSHGMRRKVALCGALVHDPQILILDEPTIGLDPKSARNLKEILRGMVSKGGTVFMTTHILEIAENMGNRIGIIHKGELIANGTTEELRRLSNREHKKLEDIFLELTGAQDADEVASFLVDE